MERCKACYQKGVEKIERRTKELGASLAGEFIQISQGIKCKAANRAERAGIHWQRERKHFTGRCGVNSSWIFSPLWHMSVMFRGTVHFTATSADVDPALRQLSYGSSLVATPETHRSRFKSLTYPAVSAGLHPKPMFYKFLRFALGNTPE
jgi:hypothetical protein